MPARQTEGMMSDIQLFLTLGWRNAWKERLIFLFDGLVCWVVIPDYSSLLKSLTESAPLLGLFLAIALVCGIFFSIFAGPTGTIYIAFSAAIGEHVSLSSAWQVVKNYWQRVALSFLLVMVCFLPFECALVALSSAVLPQALRPPHTFLVVQLPLSLTVALGYFSMAGIVARDLGIRKSLANAWTVFVGHFGALAILGLIFQVMQDAWIVIAGMLAMLIKSGFNPASLQGLDYLSPWTSFPHDLSYRLLSTAGGVVLTAVGAAAFMVAYLKYGGARISRRSQTRNQQVSIAS